MAAKHNDQGNSLVEWKQKSKRELKKKIRSNLERRGARLSEIVNNTTKLIIPDIEQLYSQRALIAASLNDIFMKVDEWNGVNILAMNNAPKTFEQYYKRSDNWWNRCKAEWTGDYYFYPFFRTELRQYIEKVVNSGRITNDLLYFMVLSNIINAEIHYHRCKAQPLVLDKSFLKSRDLNHLFHGIGLKHCIPWQIPPRDNNNRGHYRTIVREFANKWAHSLLEEKQIEYNKYIKNKKINHNNHSHSQPINYCFNEMKPEHVQTPFVSQKHTVTHANPAQKHRVPMRYHPYRVPNKSHNNNPPKLSAQCQIKVYTTEHNNNGINTQSVAYTGIHGHSNAFISGNSSA